MGSVKVPQAAVDAAMRAMECVETFDHLTHTAHCRTHNFGWLSDVDACPHAERVAAAVVAAVQGPMRAEALREAADAWGGDLTTVTRWLRARADRIESLAVG